MIIAVPIKIVADDQDLVVNPDLTIDGSKAPRVVSSYDLNAIEAAVQLAEGVQDARVVAVSVADAKADDSKLKKNILARGVDEFVLMADDACAVAWASRSAQLLAGMIADLQADLVICGDGSADNYAQQVDVQLADTMGLPVVTAACSVALEEGQGTVVCDRSLETVVQTVRAALPAVVSVVPDAALPRIPGMKDILAAGKKPTSLVAVPAIPEPTVETLSIAGIKAAERQMKIFDMSVSGDVAAFAAELKSAL